MSSNPIGEVSSGTSARDFNESFADFRGDVDICPKAWGPMPFNVNGGNAHVDFLENLMRKQ
jgi:hypothetical protein